MGPDVSDKRRGRRGPVIKRIYTGPKDRLQKVQLQNVRLLIARKPTLQRPGRWMTKRVYANAGIPGGWRSAVLRPSPAFQLGPKVFEAGEDEERPNKGRVQGNAWFCTTKESRHGSGQFLERRRFPEAGLFPGSEWIFFDVKSSFESLSRMFP